MKRRIFKQDWEELETTRHRHNLVIVTVNVAVILGVFVAAAIIQFT